MAEGLFRQPYCNQPFTEPRCEGRLATDASKLSANPEIGLQLEHPGRSGSRLVEPAEGDQRSNRNDVVDAVGGVRLNGAVRGLGRLLPPTLQEVPDRLRTEGRERPGVERAKPQPALPPRDRRLAQLCTTLRRMKPSAVDGLSVTAVSKEAKAAARSWASIPSESRGAESLRSKGLTFAGPRCCAHETLPDPGRDRAYAWADPRLGARTPHATAGRRRDVSAGLLLSTMRAKFNDLCRSSNG